MKIKILKLSVILIALSFVASGFAFTASAEAPEEEWDKTFGGSDEDLGLSVQQTSDGEYIIAGFTELYGAGDADVWLIKV